MFRRASNSTTNRRSLFGIVVFVLAYLAQPLHLLVHDHHGVAGEGGAGTTVHCDGGGCHGAARSSGAAEPDAERGGPLVQGEDESHGEHETCSIVALGTPKGLPSAFANASFACRLETSAPLALHSADEVSGPERYRLAPKNSPPLRG